jgi:hypothetical protein
MENVAKTFNPLFTSVRITRSHVSLFAKAPKRIFHFIPIKAQESFGNTPKLIQMNWIAQKYYKITRNKTKKIKFQKMQCPSNKTKQKDHPFLRTFRTPKHKSKIKRKIKKYQKTKGDPIQDTQNSKNILQEFSS